MVGGQVLGADVDVDVALAGVQEVSGQLLHLLGPGGGPHEDLTVWADLLEDLPDLGLEAHVQHSVSLVQAQVGDPLQVHLASLQEVNQPPGCRDHDLAAVLDVPQLRALGSSSEHTGVLDAGGFPELIGHFLDLLCQLPKIENNNGYKVNFNYYFEI